MSVDFEHAVIEWLRANQLPRALQTFEHGRRCLASIASHGSSGAGHVWIHTRDAQQWIGGSFASLCSGAATWFIPPTWLKHQLTSLADGSAVRWILSDRGWERCSLAPDAPAAILGSMELGGRLLIPTGGSSGRTQFAIHPWSSMHSAVHAVALHFLGRLARRGDFNACHELPLWHVSGWMQVVRAFVSESHYGLGLNALDRWEASRRGRWVSVVPTQLRRMLANDSALDRLRSADFLIVGGGPCPVDLLDASLRATLTPWVTYGMTETLGMVAGKCIRTPADFEAPASVFPGTTVEIALDPNLLATQGKLAQGEILLRSDRLCEGYARVNSGGALVLETLPAVGLRTRDIGSVTSDGCLHVWGRLDDLIITGGEKVNPREVEGVVRTLPGVADCLVAGVSDPEWGQRVVCLLVESEAGAVSDLTVLSEQLAGRMESFKIPKAWRCIESLPFDAKGKILRSQLQTLLSEVVANPPRIVDNGPNVCGDG